MWNPPRGRFLATWASIQAWLVHKIPSYLCQNLRKHDVLPRDGSREQCEHSWEMTVNRREEKEGFLVNNINFSLVLPSLPFIRPASHFAPSDSPAFLPDLNCGNDLLWREYFTFPFEPRGWTDDFINLPIVVWLILSKLNVLGLAGLILKSIQLVSCWIYRWNLVTHPLLCTLLSYNKHPTLFYSGALEHFF